MNEDAMEPCGEQLNTDSSLTTANKATKVIHGVLDAALKTCSGLSPSTAAKHIITVMGKKERLGSLRINSPRLNKFTTELNFVDAMSSTLPLEEQRTGLKLDAARSYLSSMNLAPDKKEIENHYTQKFLPTSASSSERNGASDETSPCVRHNWKTIEPTCTFLNDDQGTILEKIRTKLDSTWVKYRVLRQGDITKKEKQEGCHKIMMYTCKIGKKKTDKGNCRIRLSYWKTTALTAATATQPGISINIDKAQAQVSVDSNCLCSKRIHSTHGIPINFKPIVTDLARDLAHHRPSTIKRKIMTEAMNSSDPSTKHLTTDKNYRTVLAKQINNRVKFIRKKARRDRSLPHNCITVGGLNVVKDCYKFTPPGSPLGCVKTENEIQKHGRTWYREGNLKVFDTNDVTNKEINAYRMMTVLDPTIDIDDTVCSENEINLWNYIQQKIQRRKNVESYEGSTMKSTTVFTSVALLWNLCQCHSLKWEVMASADGTDSKLICQKYYKYSSGQTLISMCLHFLFSKHFVRRCEQQLAIVVFWLLWNKQQGCTSVLTIFLCVVTWRERRNVWARHSRLVKICPIDFWLYKHQFQGRSSL